MKIDKLYVYPIKSMRGVSVDSAPLTKHGFPYDRCFMILKVEGDGEGEGNGEKQQQQRQQPTYKNMTVAHFNEMVFFHPEMRPPADGDETAASIRVHHRPPADAGKPSSIDIPLRPNTTDLPLIDVEMHLAPTKAFRMPARYNDWLSDRFGHECVLAYIGPHTRAVRYMGMTGDGGGEGGGGGWLGSLATTATSLIPSSLRAAAAPPPSITFSDVAPYLVVNATSLTSALSRVTDGSDFDVTKFRPNIVVSGAEEAWEEDFWAELTITPISSSSSSSAGSGGPGVVRLECEHNCARCRSINIDYATGAQGEGDAGTMLKKLAADRRVDEGAKWSPVFGRYAFWRGKAEAEGEGDTVSVGDEVVVSRRNDERTRFDWKGLSTLPGGGKDK